MELGMLEWTWEHVKDIAAVVGMVVVVTTLSLTVLNRRDLLRDKASERSKKTPFARIQISSSRSDGWRAAKLFIHNPSGEQLEAEKLEIDERAGILITLHASNRDVNARKEPDVSLASPSCPVAWTIPLPSDASSSFSVVRDIWLKLPDRKAGNTSSRSSRIVVSAKTISANERRIEIVAPIPMDA